MPAPQQGSLSVFKETSGIPRPNVASGRYDWRDSAAASLAQALKAFAGHVNQLDDKATAFQQETNEAYAELGLEPVEKDLIGRGINPQSQTSSYDKVMGKTAADEALESIYGSFETSEVQNMSPAQFAAWYDQEAARVMQEKGAGRSQAWSLGYAQEMARNKRVLMDKMNGAKQNHMVEQLTRSQMLKVQIAAEGRSIDQENSMVAQRANLLFGNDAGYREGILELYKRGFGRVVGMEMTAEEWAREQGLNPAMAAEMRNVVMASRSLAGFMTQKPPKEKNAEAELQLDGVPDAVTPVDNFGASNIEVQRMLQEQQGVTAKQLRSHLADAYVGRLLKEPDGLRLDDEAIEANIKSLGLNAEQAQKVRDAAGVARQDAAYLAQEKERQLNEATRAAIEDPQALNALKDVDQARYSKLLQRRLDRTGSAQEDKAFEETLDFSQQDIADDITNAYLDGVITEQGYRRLLETSKTRQAVERAIEAPAASFVVDQIASRLPDSVRDTFKQAVGTDLAAAMAGEDAAPLTTGQVFEMAEPIAQRLVQQLQTEQQEIMQRYMPQQSGMAAPDGTPVEPAAYAPEEAASSSLPPFEAPQGVTSITSAPPAVADDTEFLAGVEGLSQKYGIDPNFMLSVMDFETGGSFDPGQRNAAGSSATGLIQFMASTATALGTSTSELAGMTRVQQLEYVDKYLAQFKPAFDKIRARGGQVTLDDLYMSVLFPAAIGKSPDYALFKAGTKAYRQNAGLDSDRDGRVTKQEAATKVNQRLQKFA